MGLGYQVLDCSICDLEFDRHVPRKPRPLGRGQGAQYKRQLPYREALPCRAGSFKLLGSFPHGDSLATAEDIGAGFDWVTHDKTLEFSNSYE